MQADAANQIAELSHEHGESPVPAHPDRDHDRLPAGTRLWFIGFVLWMTACAIVARLAFEQAQLGNPIALPLWVLSLMCFYLSLCNTFVPLPTAWIVLLAASPDFPLFESAAARVLVVALCGTISTVAANLTEYHLLAYVFRFGLGSRLRRTRLYGWAARWFDRAPFQLLTLIAFVPIPIDAVRWLAVLRHYSRVRFATAYFLGRGLRYVLFALCAVQLELSGWQILGIQGGLLLLAIIGRTALWLRRRSQRAHGEANEVTLEDLSHDTISGT